MKRMLDADEVERLQKQEQAFDLLIERAKEQK